MLHALTTVSCETSGLDRLLPVPDLRLCDLPASGTVLSVPNSSKQSIQHVVQDTVVVQSRSLASGTHWSAAWCHAATGRQ